MRRIPSFASVVFVVVFAVRAASAAAPVVESAATATSRTGPAAPTFEGQVRSILKAHCFHCHGEEDELQGGLDLRLVRTMTQGGESGSALVPGDHAKSLLYRRIAEGEMPPGEKKMSAAELAVLARWIDGGTKTAKPEPASVSEFTDEERAFWSFQPIGNPTPPQVRDAKLVRTPIDAFLLAELERRNLSFSPEADATVLCRRLYFDLLGLPPTPEEVDEFVRAYSVARVEDKEKAYEALIDKLSASPHYGERWGRHWLDVAGYSDSDGYTALDAERKYAYRYRDYVIRSFNADKPWNEFIVEQLAGDELVRPPYDALSTADLDKLIATGFLRMGPDGTGDTSADAPTARNDCVAETLKIVSTSLLGLTVGCAQCHNHRYDPISQVDYYRFRAIFEPAYDVKNWRMPAARLISTTAPDVKRKIAAVDAEIAQANKEKTDELNRLIEETVELALKKLPKELHDPIRKARATPADKQTAEQKKLLKENPSVNITATGVRQELSTKYRAWEKKYDELLAQLRASRPEEEYVQALTEIAGKAPTTVVFYRGDHNQPRQAVKPAELAIVASVDPATIVEKDAALPSTGRRLAYARHLVDGRHPLTARVLANRFWLHHFGRGLVPSPGDFGFLGERPTHPELLDWLARDFMAGGWRLKRLHKTILTSTAYRQSSARTERLDAVDPDNRLWGRMSIRRLEAEVIRDAVLAVSGRLNRKQFGPPVAVMPDETGQVVIGVDTRDTAGRPTGKKVDLGDAVFRRSLYVQARRTLPLGMLETFDAPTMTPNCERRDSSTVTPQSLLLMNSEFIVAESEAFARRLKSAAPDDLSAQLKLGWRLTFGRAPSDAHVAEAAAFVREQTATLRPTIAPPPAKPAADAPASPTAEDLALASFCQALLSANGFLYVD